MNGEKIKKEDVEMSGGSMVGEWRYDKKYVFRIRSKWFVFIFNDYLCKLSFIFDKIHLTYF